jgi:hypothetical protein
VMSTPLRLCPGRPHRVKHSAMSGNGETPWRRSSVASADHPLKPLLPASCCIAANCRELPLRAITGTRDHFSAGNARA